MGEGGEDGKSRSVGRGAPGSGALLRRALEAPEDAGGSEKEQAFLLDLMRRVASLLPSPLSKDVEGFLEEAEDWLGTRRFWAHFRNAVHTAFQGVFSLEETPDPEVAQVVRAMRQVWGEGDTGLAAWVASRGDLLRRLLEGPHAVREEEAKEVLERTGELFRALRIRDGGLWKILEWAERDAKEGPFFEPSPIDEGRSKGWGVDLQMVLRLAFYYTPMGFGADPLVVQALRRVLRGG